MLLAMVTCEEGHGLRSEDLVNVALGCDAILSVCTNILEHMNSIGAYSTPNHDALATPRTSHHNTCVSVALTPPTLHTHSAIQGNTVPALMREDYRPLLFGAANVGPG